MTVSTLTVVPEATASGTAPCAEPADTPELIVTTLWRRPRLLDLFCGAGGASAGYHAAGFDVTGVDIAPQPDYPFRFVQADALTVDLAGFDVVAASPPCQRWCAATPAGRRDDHPDLIAPIRRRLVQAVIAPGGPSVYVIENVPGAPLVDPVTVCGDALRLGVRRHRLFESNVPLVGTRCWHDRPAPPVAVYGTYSQRPGRHHNALDTAGWPAGPAGSAPSTDQARAAMGIDWMPWPALTQAIPPAYTYWLGAQLLASGRIRLAESAGSGACVTDSAAETSPDHDHVQEGSVTLVDGETSPGDGSRRRGSVTDAGALRHNPRHCRCGKPLPARPATGRWPRYCSHACRQAAYRDRQRISGGPS
jgi:hypothetical protein